MVDLAEGTLKIIVNQLEQIKLLQAENDILKQNQEKMISQIQQLETELNQLQKASNPSLKEPPGT